MCILCHVEECKFQLGSFQYRGDQLRFVLADLLQEEERRNVLLEHLTLTQLQVILYSTVLYCIVLYCVCIILCYWTTTLIQLQAGPRQIVVGSNLTSMYINHT